MTETMMDILDRLNRHVAAVGFIADHADDNQTAMALSTIEEDMIKTVELLGNMKSESDPSSCGATGAERR